jgi:hypothetical protein
MKAFEVIVDRCASYIVFASCIEKAMYKATDARKKEYPDFRPRVTSISEFDETAIGR